MEILGDLFFVDMNAALEAMKLLLVQTQTCLTGIAIMFQLACVTVSAQTVPASPSLF